MTTIKVQTIPWQLFMSISLSPIPQKVISPSSNATKYRKMAGFLDLDQSRARDKTMLLHQCQHLDLRITIAAVCFAAHATTTVLASGWMGFRGHANLLLKHLKKRRGRGHR